MSSADPDPTPVPPAPAPARQGSNWTLGRVLAVLLASIAGLIGLGMLLGGGAIIVAHGVVRDDDGFYESGDEIFETDAYAITTDEIDLDLGPGDWAPEDLLGTVRIGAESRNDQPIFIGVARDADIQRYLTDVRHAVLTDFDNDSDPQFELRRGNSRPKAPGIQNFWEASTEGSGRQEIEWDVESGVWSIAVMNADASAGVAVDAEAGVKIGWLIWVGIGLLIAGLILTAVAVILVIVVSRRASRDAALAAPPPAQAA
jgi:hypothetical protein